MNIPAELKDLSDNGQLSVWVGAGMSTSAGFPTWSQLVELLVEHCVEIGLEDADRSELRSMLLNNLHDAVVQFCRGFLTETNYLRFMRKTFEGRASQEVHELIVKVGFNAILTTNYDDLLEKAVVKVLEVPPVTVTNADVEGIWSKFVDGSPMIVKVHGDINRPATTVLSSSDYVDLVNKNTPFMYFLQRLFSANSVLFLGYSLQDWYINRILEECVVLTGNAGPPHYAVIPITGRIQAQYMRERYNINALSFDPTVDGYSLPIERLLEQLT